MNIMQNYINGEFVDSKSGETMKVYAPMNGEVHGRCPNSNQQDVDLALDAAEKAAPLWKKMGSDKRAQILLKIADLIDAKRDELALAETLDNGKPIQVSKNVDIPRAALNIRFFAELVGKSEESSFTQDRLAHHYNERRPLGVVSCISPWNLPLYLLTWKIAPALATGNTVVAKPSEVTPYTAFLFSKLCLEAGLPAGVLNILHGEGPRMGESLVTDSRVKAVSFTGSTATGRIIHKLAADHFKKTSLEMGGKNPFIVFDSADLKKTAKMARIAAYSNQGQICLCGSRILVQENIYEEFKSYLIEEVKKISVGDPTDDKTEMGAVVSAPHKEKILSFLSWAKENDAKFLVEGNLNDKPGYFVHPHLVEGLSNECKFNQEEIFGPVAALIPFKDEAEAIKLANDTRYGLAASFWTNDLGQSQRVSEALDFGIVWVNTWMTRDLRIPFGGVKESGMGREGGKYALNFFTEVKSVCVSRR